MRSPSNCAAVHSLRHWIICAAVVHLNIAAPIRAELVGFSVIGDYGVDNADELAVAGLVRTNLQPQFIITTGDNNYFAPSEIDRAIGKYYSEFIGHYSGAYGSGASSNRFFPALGNHDWNSASGYGGYTNYFTLPGNERYYDLRSGPLHLFIVNSDPNEPHGTTSSSQQARWLSNELYQSEAPWKVVAMHHAPYSSRDAADWMRWPYADWGAALVLAGHAHHYERLTNAITYVVCGASGAPLHGFGDTVAGSIVRYSSAHGAMRISATETNLACQFWSVENGGRIIDEFTLLPPPRLRVSPAGNRVQVSWPTNDAAAFRLQMADALPNSVWTWVTNLPTEAGATRTVTVPASGERQFFRLRR